MIAQYNFLCRCGLDKDPDKCPRHSEEDFVLANLDQVPCAHPVRQLVWKKEDSELEYLCARCNEPCAPPAKIGPNPIED